jgi:small redox-active disulfide protein 2
MKRIQVIGMGCSKCKKLYEMAEAAAKELKIDYQMEKIDDINKIADMGVMMTPALAINDEVKISGRLLGMDELKKIISE